MIEALVPQFALEIAGSPASQDLKNDILEAIVENSLNLPDLCTLRIHDASFKWIDHPSITEGSSIRVQGSYGRQSMQTLFDGEIVGIELDLAAFGAPTLTIQCLDRSHRLHRGRQSRSFTNMTDEDVVKKVAGEFGFSVQSEATTTVHEWIFQNNQTNWEFLSMLAGRNGFRVTLKGERTLHFKKVDGKESDNPVEVQWGQELRSFKPRTNASGQVDEVEVRSWDPHTKSPISASAKKAQGVPQTGIGDGSINASKAFGEAKLVVVDYPVHSTEEAADVARSICDEIGGSYLEAEGLLYGMPHLKAGMAIKVQNIGKRFGGVYFLTSTQHTYTPTEGFSTLFTVTGKKGASLLSLIDRQNMANRKPLGGSLVVGIVTDNKDPAGQGRVKVMYPWLTEDHTSHWARISSQMAGAGRGMFNTPEIGDEVLIAFEHGDINRPFLIGQLWNGVDKLPGLSGSRSVRPPFVPGKDGMSVYGTQELAANNPMLGPSSEVNRRGFYTRIGHLLDFDDTGGKGGVLLKTTGGNTVDVSDADKKVEVKTPGGHKVVVDDTGQKIELTTTSGHSIVMNDAGNCITITDNVGDSIMMAMGAISITALAAVAVQAPLISFTAPVMITGQAPVVNFMAGIRGRFTSEGTITFDSTEDTNMKSGAAINVDASGKIQAKAGAELDLKGTTINLNS